MAIPPGRYEFGPPHGRLLLLTGREGVAGALGHDLTLEVTAWSAEAELDVVHSTRRFAARIDLTSLTVVEARGGARPLRPADRREIEANARRALDVDQYPEAVFASSTISEDPSQLVIEGTFTLHGRSGPLRITAEETAPGCFHGHGTVVQSRFGVKPYSAMFGALKLRDIVEFDVEVQLEP